MHLAHALQGGPTFIDTYAAWYCCLVPASTAPTWNTPDTICLGRNTYLGVPHPSIDASTVAHSYWNVPMDGPAALCAPGAVSQLVVHGRYRKAEADRAAFEAETAEAHRD
ncbi:hypothetical protein [Streptomyces flaveus]|uniref:hypothetical protein n=1 Tax=Streptomyces flaveus TaxID=66370 RepID=UPI00332AD383